MTVGRVIDVSSNNHPRTAPIDWPQVKAAGVTTVLVKATQGVGYTNPWYQRDLAGALGQGMDVLAYHFAAFGTVSKEAARFQAVAGLTYAKILDSEMSTNVAWMNDFLRALGCPPTRLLDYGSASALSGIGGQLRAMLWVAAYGQGYPGYGVMWQFTDAATIPGIAGPVDESRWYGTTEQYDRLFNKFDPPPPITTTPEVPTMTNAAFVRWAYRFTLYREVDPAGYTANMNWLAAGGSRAQVIENLQDSAEGVAAIAAQRKSLGL